MPKLGWIDAATDTDVPMTTLREIGPDSRATLGDSTVTDSPNVVWPPEFRAVTVYTAVAVAAAGVPEITPVLASRFRPAGSGGETL
jgi:hypothetical protein